MHRAYPKPRADGYRSGLEAKLGQQMDKAGVAFRYEALAIPFVQPAEKRRYTPDFFLPNGIIIEAKGQFTSADRKKLKLVKAQYPDLDLRLVFSRSTSRLSKKSKTTYGKWCRDHGFPYQDKVIPAAWFREPPNGACLAILRDLEGRRSGGK